MKNKANLLTLTDKNFNHQVLENHQPVLVHFRTDWSGSSDIIIPIIELTAGALVILGMCTRPALLALGAVLVTVTFGHLLAEPLYQFHTHVIPRTALLLFVLVMPRSKDRLSLDAWIASRRTPSS